MSDGQDPLKGYRGLARQRLEAWGVRVWSDVQVVNSAGSVFEGVILPRSENADDLHIVLKQKTGYNVGIHVDRVASIEEVGHKEAIYKIPEKAFPKSPDPAERHAAGNRRHDRIASGLSDRRGDSGLHAGRTLRRRPGTGRHLQHDDQQDLRRVLREHGLGTIRGAGRGSRRGNTRWCGWNRDRTRHRHDGAHGRRPQLHGPGQPGADRPGRQPAQQRSAVERCGTEPDPRRQDGRAQPHCRSADLHVRPDLRSVRTAAPRNPLPQNALVVSQHVSHDWRYSAVPRLARLLRVADRRFRAPRSASPSEDRRRLRRPRDHSLLLSRHEARSGATRWSKKATRGS